MTKRILALLPWTIPLAALAIYAVPVATGHDTALKRAGAVVFLIMGLLVVFSGFASSMPPVFVGLQAASGYLR